MMRQGGLRTTAAFVAALACAGCGAGQFSPRIVRAAEAGRGETIRLAEAQFRQGNIALALQHYRRAMRDAPGDIDAFIGIAACYDRMGRFELSRHYYEEALAIDPNDRRARHNFALSLRLQGRGEEAARFAAEGAPPPAAAPATSVASLPAAVVETSARASNPAAKRLERLSLTEVAIVTEAASAIPPRTAQPAPAVTLGATLTRATGKEIEWQLDEEPARRAPPPALAAASPAGSAPPPAPVEPRARPAAAPPPAAAPTSARAAPSPVAGLPRPPALASATARAPAPAQRLRLLNGVGRRGLAARMRGYIGGEGWAAVAIGDAALRPQRSVIVYPRGARAAAATLADRLPFPAQLREGEKGREVLLMLGRDSLGFDDRMRRKIAES